MILFIISTIITGTSFIFNKLSFIMFFSLIPFYFLIDNKKYNFLYGFLYGLILTSVTSLFIFNMYPIDFMNFNKLTSFIIILFVFLFIILFEGILYGLLLCIFNKYIKNIYLFPVFYAVFEFLKSFTGLGYTFNDLYLPFAHNLYFIQLAGVFSCYIITVIILYINLLLYKFIKSKKKIYVFIPTLILTVNFIYNYFYIVNYSDKENKVNIALIQGNINSNEKWQNKNIYDISEKYKNITKNIIEKNNCDIVVWPETVIPVPIHENHNIFNDFQSFADTNNINLITGAFIKENGLSSNSIISFNNNGNYNKFKYNKRHLIPFTERKKILNYKVDGDCAIKTKNGNIGCFICIDSCFPHLLYEMNNKEIDYYIALTNDSWFKNSYLLNLHNNHNIYRAIESRKYFIQCANTGVTNIIMPTGKIKNKIPVNTNGYLYTSVNY